MQNHSNYPTVCLLLDTAQKTDNVITVCGKWIFDYNLEFALPLTKASLNYICSGHDTDNITFVGVLHSIRAMGIQKRSLRYNQEIKKNKDTLSNSGMEYIHNDIWYIAESF